MIALWLLTAGCKTTAPLPARAAELNRSGVQALEQGDLETAGARFALALEYSPRFVEALSNQGLVELQRGNFVRARQLLGRARRLNPDIAQPHHGLGVLAEREGRPDRASEYYREALRVDPGFAPARANLARLLFENSQLEHALVQFKLLVEVAPQEPLGHRGLCEVLLRLGRVHEAEAVLSEARLRFGDRPEIVLLDARAHLRRGDIDGAVELLQPLALQRNELAAAALGWMAVAELAAGQPRRAAGAADRALRLEPHEPVAVYALAIALSELGEPSADRWLSRARKLAPGDPALERLARERAKR